MHSHNNGLKTALLMGSMVGMMLLIGGMLSATFRTSIFIWAMVCLAWVRLRTPTGTPISSPYVP